MAKEIFVNNSGNDNSSGGISQPFKTFTRAYNAFVPGDSIYGFGGHKFNDSIHSLKHGLKIGQYGGSEKVKWSGYLPLSGWVSLGGGKYECHNSSLLSTVMVLKIDGTKQAKGRWPKVSAPIKGYLNIAQNSPFGSKTVGGKTYSSTTIHSNAISSAPNFVGGDLVFRSHMWWLSRTTVEAQRSNQVDVLSWTKVRPFRDGA